MKSKFKVGDSLLVKGTVKRITINRDGVIRYDLDIEETYMHMLLYDYRKKKGGSTNANQI